MDFSRLVLVYEISLTVKYAIEVLDKIELIRSDQRLEMNNNLWNIKNEQ